MKCGIKNGPPWAQAKLSAPTPQDSTDNSPSARETQALSVRKAPIVWIQPPSIFPSPPFSTTQTLLPPHLPCLAHHTYAGDDNSPPHLMALTRFFSIHWRQILMTVQADRGSALLLLKPFFFRGLFS